MSSLKPERLELFERYFYTSPYGALIADSNGQLFAVNDSFCQISGFTAEELAVQDIRHLFVRSGEWFNLDYFHRHQVNTFTGVLDLMCKDCRPFQTCFTASLLTDLAGQSWISILLRDLASPNHDRTGTGLTMPNPDDKEARKCLIAEILYANNHDSLTGLMNRNAINQLVALEQSDPAARLGHSVIAINIDKFRLVNDALGHQAGDYLLKQIAEKIQTVVGHAGFVYRFGGDEFVVVAVSGQMEHIREIATEIQRSIARKIIISGRMVYITASIGICIGNSHVSLDQTVKNADTALYIAKKQRNAIIFYTADFEKARTREELLEQDLYSALDKDQFELHYQPIFDVRTGLIDQAEALLRWNHPEFGQVAPLEFIPIAERTKLIIPITDWVIRQACLRVAAWESIGIHSIMVSVNLSLLSFENRGSELTDYITSTIRETGIRPTSLKLEITESTLMNDLDEILKVFRAMKQIGVKLALDDFGTGYSSFGYMKDLPLDIIKLDRTLISHIGISKTEQMIVESMVTIIHGLGLEVVIEGVETKEQFDSLKPYYCDYMQGFLFSKPLPVTEFERFYFSVKEQGPEAFIANRAFQLSCVYLTWRNEWNSGDGTIDQQHQVLLQDANLIMNLALDYACHEAILEAVNDLMLHISQHFEYEERVLQAAGYPAYMDHAKEHQLLFEKATRLREGYILNGVNAAAFFTFLIDRLILGHLLDYDMKYIPYICREGGVCPESQARD